jgi:hypothetical protein
VESSCRERTPSLGKMLPRWYSTPGLRGTAPLLTRGWSCRMPERATTCSRAVRSKSPRRRRRVAQNPHVASSASHRSTNGAARSCSIRPRAARKALVAALRFPVFPKRSPWGVPTGLRERRAHRHRGLVAAAKRGVLFGRALENLCQGVTPAPQLDRGHVWRSVRHLMIALGQRLGCVIEPSRVDQRLGFEQPRGALTEAGSRS